MSNPIRTDPVVADASRRPAGAGAIGIKQFCLIDVGDFSGSMNPYTDYVFTFDDISWDTGGFGAVKGAKTLACEIAGLYLFNAEVQTSTSSSPSYEQTFSETLEIVVGRDGAFNTGRYVSGISVAAESRSSNSRDTSIMNISGVLMCDVGDIVKVRYYFADAESNYRQAGVLCEFSATRLGDFGPVADPIPSF